MGSLYGFEVKSELPLRRLNSAAGTRGELRIEGAAAPLERPARGPVSTLVTEEGRCWYASYEFEDGRCLIELPPSGSFLIEPAAGRILVERDGDDAELLEHRIVSSAAGLLLGLRGDLFLHAAAVETSAGAVLLCGPSQRGKSSLARALGASGHPVVGEDGVAIELGRRGATAFPGARGVRVRSRDASGRPRVELHPDPGPAEPGPSAVAAVVLLEERGAALTVEPLEPARALALLTPNLVHSGGRGAIAAAFAALAQLLGSVPAFRASLPDDLEALAASALGLLDSVGVQD